MSKGQKHLYCGFTGYSKLLLFKVQLQLLLLILVWRLWILKEDSFVREISIYFLSVHLNQILNMPHSGFTLQLPSTLETSVLTEKCGSVRLSGFLLLCQDYRILCPEWGPWCWSPVNLREPNSNPLYLSDLAPSSRSEGFFVFPSLHLSWKKSLFTPLVLLPLKTLCKVYSIHLQFYKTQEVLLSWSNSGSTLLSLQVSFVSFLF